MGKKQRKINPEYKETTEKENGERAYIQLDEFPDESRIGRQISHTVQSQDKWQRVLTTVTGLSKWKDLVSKRRYETPRKSNAHLKNRTRSSTAEKYYEALNSTLNGIASECDDSSSEEGEDIPHSGNKKKLHKFTNLSKSSNRALLIYFSKLARSISKNDALDLDFIESLINNGADINMCDKYGQTIFHEVARIWHCDVGWFLLELKADLTCVDKFGRTPLHVAAAVNYPDMVKFLIEKGAAIEARTYGEQQTALHYAAKNDAVDSLKMLIKMGSDIESTDSKRRTPLQVAAELDRSETALFLVEQGATVGVCDSSGLSALTLMIEKMPLTAKYALEQYHKTDRPNRKQYFYLNLLEPVIPGQVNVTAKTPMQAVIHNKQMNLLLHPVFKRLLQVKWTHFARKKHCINFLLQLTFVLLWSVVGVTTPANSSLEYSKPFKDVWWRIVLESLAMVMTVYFIIAELYEWHSSIRDHNRWQKWRSREMEKDLAYCHPRWPEERKYIVQELDRIQTSNISYFADPWNVFDWIVYLWIVAGIIPRIVSLTSGDRTVSEYHREILATSMIVIWVRLLKVMRAFQALGPFIVMLGHILRDTLRFGFLYFEFFIPYIIAFWMIFGGSERGAMMVKNGQSSDGWKHVNDLIYSVWLVTVVGEYDYNAVVSVNKIMAQVLIGTYTALSGILLLNLFIALMSDTFQRVYDNAKANALMQKAISINTHQTNLSSKASDRLRLFIHNQCAPEQLYYDDDDTDDGGELQKVTIQIKEVVDEIKEELEQQKITNSNNNDNHSNQSVTEQRLQEFYQQFNIQAKRYEEDIKRLHNKIDYLTTIVSQALPCNQTPLTQNLEGDSTRHFTKLPSIHDLKPNYVFRT